ncbi:hypothetical protein [Curtobacterium sp. MCBD17_008]|uniref:hypothetical protein n=1 Tax=Curtobacterium sp. MCBD17_008 TaxID=2175656 RepID=UPI0015E8943C|nr:hypothetical protein [Curtobacterium sp. MCBD17_008]
MPASPPDRPALFVVQYRWPLSRDADVRAAYATHRADVDRLGRDGGLWMIGTLPAVEGWSCAMAVFRSEPAARAFRDEDPLFTAGLATPSPVQSWSPLTFQR